MPSTPIKCLLAIAVAFGITLILSLHPLPHHTNTVFFWKQNSKFIPPADSSSTIPSVENQAIDLVAPATSEAALEKVTTINTTNLASRSLESRIKASATADLLDVEGHDLFVEWANKSPAAAVEWANQLPDRSARDNLVQAGILAWSQADLKQALQWVNNLSESDTIKQRALVDLGYEVARTDPLSALAIVNRVATPEADGLLLHAISQFTIIDARAAQYLATGLPAGSLRDQALFTVAVAQSAYDGAGASLFACENIMLPSSWLQTSVGIFQNWAQYDTTNALLWVMTQSDPLRRDQLISRIDWLFPSSSFVR